MKSHTKFLAALTSSLVLVGAAAALATTDEKDGSKKADSPKTVEVGKKALDFELTDLNGKKHKLSDHKGKTIILEWFNPECPFVVHIYKEDHPYREWTRKLHEDENYVWLAINSGAPGLQGAGLEKNRQYQKDWMIQYPILLDEDGKVGRMYEARTTPHMYIIDKEFVLRYAGAIDNSPFGRVQGEGEQVNYVKQALAMLKAGETVMPTTTRPYGCSVKYADAARPSRERSDRGERGRRGNATVGGS